MQSHLQHIHLWVQHKADSDGAYVLSHHSQIITQHPLVHVKYARMILKITIKSCKHLAVQISRKEITSGNEMWQSLQPHHCNSQNLQKVKMTLSSLMAIYSVMRDIHDAKSLPMERGWVALSFFATYKYANQLTLKQWAFENGLLFLNTNCRSRVY